MLTCDIFFRELPINSFKVVLPQLPVIPIIFVLIFFLKIFDASVRSFNEFFIFICLFLLRPDCILLTIANDAFFLNACATKLFASIFLPFIAKNMSFFFTSLEFILA